MEESILSKILDAKPDYYIIFFDYGCRYSENALELLRDSNVKYKGYQIIDIPGGLSELIKILNNGKLPTTYEE